jgi:RecB family endonuclease NucS
MFKADGSFLVHDDAGGFRPLNWIRTVFRPNVGDHSLAQVGMISRQAKEMEEICVV